METDNYTRRKHDMLFQELKSDMKAIFGKIEKIEEITTDILVQATKTNGRVTAIEDKKLDGRIRIVEDEVKKAIGGMKVFLWMGGAFLAIMTLLGYYYMEFQKKAIAVEIINIIEKDYSITIK